MGYGLASQEFDRAVQAAASRLVGVEAVDGGYVVSTSSLFPSGAVVQVRAAFDGNSCYVSDMGLAYHEAEMLGATPRQFRRQAKAVADDLGVHFDDHSLFIVQVPMARLAGAIKIVCAAAHKAALLTDVAMAEQSERNDRELLLDRLTHVFGARSVEKNVQVLGQSGHQWTVAGRVRLTGNGILFDTATPALSSVVSVNAKFNDVERAGQNRAVIALAEPAKFAPDLKRLLEQAGEVIPIDAATSRYEAILAEAA